VTGECRKVQIDKPHNLYSSPNIVSLRFDKGYYCNQMKEDEMDGACSTHRRYEKYIHNFSLNISSKGLFEKPRHRWKDNIK
jgi:hypothetical protein